MNNAHRPADGTYAYGGGARRLLTAGRRSRETCLSEFVLFKPLGCELVIDFLLTGGDSTLAEAPLKEVIRTQSSVSNFKGPTKLSPKICRVGAIERLGPADDGEQADVRAGEESQLFQHGERCGAAADVAFNARDTRREGVEGRSRELEAVNGVATGDWDNLDEGDDAD